MQELMGQTEGWRNEKVDLGISGFLGIRIWVGFLDTIWLSDLIPWQHSWRVARDLPESGQIFSGHPSFIRTPENPNLFVMFLFNIRSNIKSDSLDRDDHCVLCDWKDSKRILQGFLHFCYYCYIRVGWPYWLTDLRILKRKMTKTKKVSGGHINGSTSE